VFSLKDELDINELEDFNLNELEEIVVDDQYLVGTIDGSIHGLRKEDGEHLWSSNQLGGPLIQSFMSTEDGVVIPSEDGRLYFSRKGEEIALHDLSVPDLVDACPFTEEVEHGEIHVVGMKSSSTYYVDPKTGKTILTVSPKGIEHVGEFKNSLITIQRTDYVVRAFDIQNAGKELWNFSYSTLNPPSNSNDPRGPSTLNGLPVTFFTGSNQLSLKPASHDAPVFLQSIKYHNGRTQVYATTAAKGQDIRCNSDIFDRPVDAGSLVPHATAFCSKAEGRMQGPFPVSTRPFLLPSRVTADTPTSYPYHIVAVFAIILIGLIARYFFKRRQLKDHSSKRIGSLHVDLENILGSGCNGTTVYKGKLNQRPVAVKRVLVSQYKLVDKEVDLLIKSDGHPNVVRYFTKEVSRDFLYLALELCDMTLVDAVTELKTVSAEWKQTLSKTALRNLGIPRSSIDFLRDLAGASNHLHELKIVHCDIKPQNILVLKKTKTGAKSHGLGCLFTPKISDMGLGRRFTTETSTFMNNTTSVFGSGTCGWRAPELMRQNSDKYGRKVDVFSMGCVFFFVITGGSNPFGNPLEQDKNISEGNPLNMAMIERYPEAYDLISKMINHQPENRPTMSECLVHPFLWTNQQKLDFLKNVSDRLEAERVKTQTVAYSVASADIHEHVENYSIQVFGTQGWLQRLHPLLRGSVVESKRRYYATHSLRDLLRLIRNSVSHIRELDPELRELLTPMPGALLDQFIGPKRFPALVLTCYKFVARYFAVEEEFLPFCIQPAEPEEESPLLKIRQNDENHVREIEIEKLKPKYIPPMMKKPHDAREIRPPPGFDFVPSTVSRAPSYKTFICKNWETTGECSHGSKCNFAHGAGELLGTS